ncbi:MAG TPA: head GIN domain-containing protein [Prolixibacteraceae bacterium]|nr:head GIN domain-containing protein [Prolixibacteraceae bacterium]
MKTIRLFSITLISLTLAFCTVSQAAKNGDSRQKRNVPSFHGISAAAGINVFLTQNDREEVIVEADEDDMDDLITKVEGGVLKIHMKQRSMLNFDWSSSERNVYVSFKNLDRIEASSSADVVSQSVLNLDRLDLNASSSATIKLELNAKEVDAESSSAADIHLKGKGYSLEANASSSSEIDASDFETKRCNANASSAADIRVYVTDELDANASSGADIAYSGGPDRKNINESSGGDIHGR